MNYLEKRDKVNSLFGTFDIAANDIDVQFDRATTDQNFYDYAVRMAGDHEKSLQQDIVEAQEKLDMRFNPAEYVKKRNTAYKRIVVNVVLERFRFMLRYYMGLGYSQEASTKMAERYIKDYTILQEKIFKEMYPHTTKEVLKKAHI